MHSIEEFYLGNATDDRGRSIEDIWTWNDYELESVHDYIQWLFPAKRPSDFNPDAPLLTDLDIAAFQSSRALQERLLKSFQRMLAFYGFQAIEREDVVVIERSPSWRECFPVWLSPGNHNHLRISRILACLRELGLGEHSRAFLETLEAVGREHANQISARTLDFWRTAAH